MPVDFILFLLCLIVVIYLIDLPLNKNTPPTIFKEVVVYASVLALLGPIAEVAINHFCRAVFDTTLWEYKIFPVHNGDTSLFSCFEWAWYGCHVYFLHKKVKTFCFKQEFLIFSGLLAVDALLFEVIVNLSGLAFINTFIFYYFPADIFHLSTFIALPFYLCLGFAVINTVKGYLTNPWFFAATSFATSYIFVFLS